ncbi:myeloperoxidase [Nasonia vitripennis]|uniref:Peroxidase n=1 Tax=Nasonia vitripennis TaxID=7425 RepID=A0A7M7PZ94_NASVI|nr:myeloperoxidase [Nasonia vitripennis]XP_031777821.1 myeloperoxidase [Nasonia vitripennis]
MLRLRIRIGWECDCSWNSWKCWGTGQEEGAGSRESALRKRGCYSQSQGPGEGGQTLVRIVVVSCVVLTSAQVLGVENVRKRPNKPEQRQMTSSKVNVTDESIVVSRTDKDDEEEDVDDVGIEPREEDLIEAADYGIQAMNELYYVKEPKLYSMGIFLSPDNPARYVAAFNEQTEEAKHLAKYGYAALEAARKLSSKYPDISRQATRTQSTRKTLLRQNCPKKGIPECPPASLRYRTADGSCNNRQELWWGSSMSTMQRFLPAVYDDNIQSIRSSVTGAPLPSAREISDYIHVDRDAPLTSVTHMLMQWGQFLDHDITATGQSRAFNGSVPQCCLNGGTGFQPPESLHPECLPIGVPPHDSHLGRLGVRCMEFVRSGPAPREDCELGTREQLSQVTSWIDASTVYSSSARQSDGLRIFRNGLLQYGKIQSRRPLLPRQVDSDLCIRGSLSTSCFRAGDNRLSEQPALTSLHVVFLRLHNRFATQLAALNQHWGDEKIFQETRRIVGAIVQHITYREFLPIVLGHDVTKIFDIEPLRKGYYEGYDPNIEPNIANGFSTAAFRFGHSLVQNSFVRFDRSHQPIFNNVSIHKEFTNPANLETVGSVDRILLGLVNQPAQKRDQFISEELTNHLFQTPGFPFGMDLASLNIQRGRDHGIPPYVDWRLPCSLSPVREWSDLDRVMVPEVAAKFRDVYAAVEDIDLFSAGLAEKPVADGLVGPTFACIIAQQFRSLRKGDRFWYENPFLESGFSPEQLQQIRRTTLAQILCRTLDNIDNIQPFVMLAADTLRNQRLDCKDPSLDQMNLDAWIERPQRREAEEEKQEVFEGRSGKAATGKNKQASGNPNAQRSPQRPKPVKTRINQNNRIVVRRPLGPHENLTIVVNNNAVNAPVFVSDSIYGSNLQINHFPSNSDPPQRPSYDSVHTTRRPPPTSQQSYENHFTTPRPYYPHNFQDPNNPNPPSYGFNTKPPNNFPNNDFFAYNTPMNLPGNIPSFGQNNYAGGQQGSYVTTKRPKVTTRPSLEAHNYFDTYQEPSFTTKKPRPLYNEPNVQYSSAEYEQEVTKPLNYNQEEYRPTKKPKPPKRPTYSPGRPQVEDYSDGDVGYQRPTRPSGYFSNTAGSGYNNQASGPSYDLQKEGVDQEMPHYLHTHSTVSNVQYVSSKRPHGSPQRQKVKEGVQLPKPISSNLQNRESSDGIVVNASTRVSTKRRKTTTTTTVPTATSDDGKRTALRNKAEKNKNRTNEEVPLRTSTAKMPLENPEENNDPSYTTPRNELPRPIKKIKKHGR